jgi:hypothetical protein
MPAAASPPRCLAASAARDGHALNKPGFLSSERAPWARVARPRGRGFKICYAAGARADGYRT